MSRKCLVVTALLATLLVVSCTGSPVPLTDAPRVTASSTLAATLTVTGSPTLAATPTVAPKAPTQGASASSVSTLTVTPSLAPASPTPVKPTVAPARATVAATASSSGEGRVDLNKIFPPGRGRDIVLQACINCHTIVPIVILQMTEEEWQRSGRNHRDRVSALNDADFKLLYEYLAANFNPDKPVPELPKELLETWTSY